MSKKIFWKKKIMKIVLNKCNSFVIDEIRINKNNIFLYTIKINILYLIYLKFF